MLHIFRGGRRSQRAARSADDERAAQSEMPAAPKAPESNAPATAAASDRVEEARQTGFAARGRLRRRGRFLRVARELAYRDLGGLVFDLDRFGQRNDAVLRAKLDTLRRIDTELRAVEGALSHRTSLTILREAGVAACPRCAAIHSSADRYCPACGLPVSQEDRPIGAAHALPQPAPAPQQAFSAPPGVGGANPSLPISPATSTPEPTPAPTPATPDPPRAERSQAADQPTEVVPAAEREAEERGEDAAAEQHTRAFDPVASIRSLRHRERR